MNMLNKMKVIQVVPSIGAESAGPSYSVPALCKGLHSAGCDVELHFTGITSKQDFSCSVFNYPTKRFPHPRLGRSPEMLNGLKSACQYADIIHNNSLWMPSNIYPAIAKQGTNCKLVMQPRGTLSTWALRNSKWKKRLIGLYGQYAAMRMTDMWVATANEEYEDIRHLGYRQPVVVLPNGVDLPNCTFVKGRSAEKRRMFFLSRIHPKKNIDMLLRCWSKLENIFPAWSLSIVGPDKNNPYADAMKIMSKQLGCKRVVFEGELNGDEKYRFMAESDCEVLPTHSENFGMVVAESLACGTPVVCSHGAPWQGLIPNRCGWWVPANEVAFENAMAEAMNMSHEELFEMGMRGREWMKRDFDWNGIGNKMKIAYEWLLGTADKPNWVRID